MREINVRERVGAMRNHFLDLRPATAPEWAEARDIDFIPSPSLVKPQMADTASLSPLYGAREAALSSAGSFLARSLKKDAQALANLAETTGQRIDCYCETSSSLQRVLDRLKQARFSQMELKWSDRESPNASERSFLAHSPKDLNESGSVLNSLMQDIRTQALNASDIAQRAGAATRQFYSLSRDALSRSPDAAATYDSLTHDVNQLEADAEKTLTIASRFQDLSEKAKSRMEHLEQWRDLSHDNSMASSIASAAQSADDATRAAQRIGALSADMTRRLDRLSERLLVLIRQSLGGDRRQSPREAFFKHCQIITERHQVNGRTLDLSEGGALLLCGPLEGFTRGQPVTLIIEDVGPLIGTVADASERGLHVSFDINHDANAGSRQSFLETLQDAAMGDADLIAHSSQLAGDITSAFERGLERGATSLDQLLSRDYVPLSDDKIMAPAQEFYDQTLQDVLANSPLCSSLYAHASDRNGYIPFRAHINEQQEKLIKPELNLSDDWGTLKAARNLKPSLIQISKIQHGNEPEQLLKNVSVPIFVRGRHWGCAEMAFPLLKSA
jgi:flagellar biosynthesis/type III secretory pathway chaperone